MEAIVIGLIMAVSVAIIVGFIRRLRYGLLEEDDTTEDFANKAPIDPPSQPVRTPRPRRRGLRTVSNQYRDEYGVLPVEEPVYEEVDAEIFDEDAMTPAYRVKPTEGNGE